MKILDTRIFRVVQSSIAVGNHHYILGSLLQNEIPSIHTLRKQLARLTLDKDSAQTRYNAAIKQTAAGGNTGANKLDGIKDELEEACNRVDQCKVCTFVFLYKTVLNRDCKLS